ncbi:hypothetical protein B0A58_09795 [Flavobacterium branchiophilum NBRC 15030 = ATCC 35035]|uniref:Putative secreted protein (Por secretion system target) n=1 Tax=Flavobacterium branchiophilum TaxID=55197 RepID=A0A543G6A2_9FLAO|nr:T9SS type A sorting domain-containing protein [Flavobacterium branchiophilum]OXA74882.1 hypothetical protein B0A58_09795 [Flavobacterium branchiophilum NBRC 15030 = ATCC 35035]TQM41504.1 putative secreted protein (Por secretion system target) [Flavobacterium branchiophilum]GEM54207.1 hypothetical protein FB1_04280 [Flavobacterium branchiophilum NBRC 15030 = ATCC 35035]
MKKLLYYCFSLLITNVIWSQTVSVNQTTPNAEVGIPTNFNLTLNPGNSPGNTHYRINYWLVIANIGNGTIQGNINGQNTYTYYHTPTSQVLALSNNTSVDIPITYGSNAPDTDNVEFQVSGSYGTVDAMGNFHAGPTLYGKYKKTNGDSGYAVDVKILCTPSISSPNILACCPNNVQICASGFCDANTFNWSITGGNIVSGFGSSCITVAPSAGNGAVSAGCTVSRSSGLSTYTRFNSSSISRTPRTASFTALYPEYPYNTQPYNYICKGGSGRQMSMATQCGISSINWVAPNCTIIGQNTLTPTIIPTNVIPTTSTINIYATVNFVGGCSVNTPAIPFKILDATNAPVPNGYFEAVPNNGDICTADVFQLNFISTDGFSNGVTTISRDFIRGPGDSIHYQPSKPTPITVCNKNLCTGLSTCTVFKVYPPAPCDYYINKSIAPTSNEKIIIAPNPTTGNLKVELPEVLTGTYQIFDQINNKLILEDKFDNRLELQIQIDTKLNNGIYILKINTEKYIFTQKIILSK